MTTLAANKPRDFEIGDIGSYPMVADDIIHAGAFDGDDASGHARPLVSGDAFLGVAIEPADNTGGAAGDRRIRVWRRRLVQLPVPDLAVTDVGRPVYATDDDTFALAGAGSFVGHVERFVSAGVGVVRFDASIPERIHRFELPVNLASVTADGDVLATFTPGFNGRVKKVEFATTVPVTTAAKRADFNLEIGTTNLTGGVVSVTSAAATPLGAIIAGTAVTGANAFKSTDTISVEAASVTAHAEGAGLLIVTCGA